MAICLPRWLKHPFHILKALMQLLPVSKLTQSGTQHLLSKKITSKKSVPPIEIPSDEDEVETPVSKRKTTPMPILGEYLLTAVTFIGIQSVHQVSKSMIEGLWSCKSYMEESALKVQKVSQDRGVDPVLKSSQAIIYSKSMKPKDYITNDVLEPLDWYDVESIMNHLARSLSKGIHVDFTIKYSVNTPIIPSMSGDAVDSDEEDVSVPVKRGCKEIH